MNSLHPRALAAAGIVSLGALLLSGCSSSSPKTVAAQPSASGSGSAQFSAYRDCLAKHGVSMPTGRPGGFSRNPSDRPSGGFSRNPSDRPSGGYGGGGFGGASANPSAQAALKACASLAPAGGFGGGRGGGGAGGTALVAFNSCMKDHGITLPANGGLRSLNTADPKTAAAYKVCKALLPTPGSTPAPTPTT
ncbi:hypothetical protein [Streptacidiphilus sp. PAMC 29251]